jgi:hypothetical protein
MVPHGANEYHRFCMRAARILAASAVLAAAALVLLAPAAASRERVMTLYSPKIYTRPYVHDTHTVTLRPNNREAPASGGYITGFKEMSLVDRKDPDARPLPNSRMMIHHFLYFAPGRVDQAPGGCWGNSGFIAGRGEEHPSGDFSRRNDPAFRARYGINNRLADGSAPTWYLTAMVMNHYREPKDFYVRTRVYYTADEQRESVMPLVVGNCATLGNGMAYDVPGGGGRGSEFVDRTDFTVPEGLNGRVLFAASHQHGGGKYQTLSSQTCGRRYFKAPVYHGTPDHIYNRIRPILHEPGPIGTGTYGSLDGFPIREGEVLSRAAVHDNSNLHVAAMGFWVLGVVKDDSVQQCGPVGQFRELNRPRRFDRTPNHGLRVPQLFRPRGTFQPFTGNPLAVDDNFFAPDRVTSRVGETVTWQFSGSEPHSVTVANGPRGFSSRYSGRTSGTYSFTPQVPGTYRLTCLVHPTTMGQDLRVSE